MNDNNSSDSEITYNSSGPANTVSSLADNSAPDFTTPIAPISPIIPTSPSGPNKVVEWFKRILNWAKNHIVLTSSLSAAVVIVALVATVLITKQPVRLFGYQLNPMVPHAQMPEACDPNDTNCVTPSGGGGGPIGGGSSGTTTTTPVEFPTVQLTAGDSNSSSPNLPDSCNKEVNGPSTNVSVSGAADCLKVTIANPKATYTKDFRICFSLNSAGEQCTPWASSGGGATSQVKTNGSFSSAQVRVESRDLPAGKVISNVEVGVQLFYQNNNGPCAQSSGLNWAKAIDGQNVSNPWSYGAQHDDDPGCGLMSLKAQLTDTSQGTPISIQGALPDGVVGTPFSQTLNVFGVANAPCTWSINSVAPQLSGATVSSGNASDTTGTTGTFTATPDTATTYQVSLLVTCQNNQTATKVLPWVVTATPTNTLAIDGAFPDGIVGKAYTTNINTLNAGSSNCVFTLTKIIAPVLGATLVRIDNAAPSTETSALFSATPTVAGDYIVSTSVSCPPVITGGSYTTVSKDFNWKVVTTPPPPPVAIQASCTDPATLPFLTAIYRLWSPAKGDHLYTTSATEKPSGYRPEGIAGYVYNKQVPGTVAVYRSNQPQIGAHYYSTTNDAAKFGYTDEGILGYTFGVTVTGSTTWYRLHKGGAESDYVNTVSEEERQAIKELGYVDEGVVAYLCGTSQPTSLQPIYRLWNGAVTEHFYTTNPAERDTVIAKGFISEGITGYMYGVHKDGTSPVFRSYHPINKHHFFSLTESEATGWGYNVEGVVGYIWKTPQSNTIPLYKLYNAKTGDNLYTATRTEADSAVKVGYQDQGTLGYMFLTAQ